MPNAANELLILALLIVANGILTAAETAFVSARREKLKQMAEAGGRGSAAALAIAEHPGRFLGFVQFSLTLTCVIAGGVVVASAAEGFASWFSRWPAVTPWVESIALVAATLGLASLMLVFGELLPKRVALSNPERAAALLGLPMRTFLRLASPLSAALGSATEALASAMGFKPRPIAETVGDEDVRALVPLSRAGVVFELGNALAARQTSRCFALVDQLLKQGEHAVGILLVAIVPTVRSLLLVKDLMHRHRLSPPQAPWFFNSILNKLPPEATEHLPRKKDGAINAYALGLAAAHAKRFELAELRELLEACLTANVRLVTSGLDERVVLAELIGRVAKR